MKKELKMFRAWAPKIKMFGPVTTLDELFLGVPGTKEEKEIMVGNLIWIQCTGLPDQTGKIIWEGDILEQEIVNEFGSFQKFIGVMEWNKEMGAFMGRYNAPHLAPHPGPQKIPRVLGNIFEHPELLK